MTAKFTLSFDANESLGFAIADLEDGKHGISTVRAGSQAETLGMRVGDMLVSIGGDALDGAHDMDMISNHLRAAIIEAKTAEEALAIIIERGHHEIPAEGTDAGTDVGTVIYK